MANDDSETALQFQNEDDLHLWLRGKPLQIGQILAFRAVLRLLPLMLYSRQDLVGRVSSQDLANDLSDAMRGLAFCYLSNRYAAFKPKITLSMDAFSVRSHEWSIGGAINAAVMGLVAYEIDTPTVTRARVVGYSGGVCENSALNNRENLERARTAFWGAVSYDAQRLSNIIPVELLSTPLWDGKIPNAMASLWRETVQLLPPAQDWDVWVGWYADRLSGVSHDSTYELIFGLVPQAKWDESTAAANKWIKEHLSQVSGLPDIPAVKPATVEPILVGEIVTISREPVDANLTAADIAAALAALRSRFERLLDEIERANIDPRFPAILRDFINRLPSSAPDTETLFDMGAELAALRGYERTVIAEWPNALSPRYSAAVLTLDLTLQKFPKWKEFAATPPPSISPQQAESISEISRVFIAAMRTEGALEHFDAVVPATLESLTNAGESVGGGIVPMAAAGRAVVAQDELESINNILKVEASILPDEPARTGIVSALKNEIKEAGDDVKKGAKEAKSKIFQAVGGALVFGPVAFLTLVAANVSGIPAFEWLLTNFKPQFGWLEPFLRVLGLL